jgi:hypothetical protein
MKKLSFSLLALSCAIGIYAGCKDDETNPPPSGGACAPAAGCPAVPSDCVALVDNSGKDKFVLRLSQLSLTAPEALKTDLIYGIISDAVYANLPADCVVQGLGSFSLITEFDKAAGTLRVGGAFPEADPTAGYCFVEDTANEIAPITIPFMLSADGVFETDPIPSVKVPVFTDATATKVVYLPLHDTVLRNAKLSADQNCIGRFAHERLDPAIGCVDDPPALEYFENGGTLEGYISLEEADLVDVELAGVSLCVLLSANPTEFGDMQMPIKRCVRDAGAIRFKGDWCSTTNTAGGCQDAVRLTADFAGSAATLKTSGCPAGT